MKAYRVVHIHHHILNFEEGFARRPGALLVARLREGGLWAELVAGPPYRVAG